MPLPPESHFISSKSEGYEARLREMEDKTALLPKAKMNYARCKAPKGGATKRSGTPFRMHYLARQIDEGIQKLDLGKWMQRQKTVGTFAPTPPRHLR